MSSKLISRVEFNICEEATEFLKQVKGPIGLVAVAGMYRTGKSYLLNRMILNKPSGFGVGPTINPCTKVSYPHIRVCGSGRNLYPDLVQMENQSTC